MGRMALTLAWAVTFIAGTAWAQQPATPFELQGFTVAMFKGDVGIFALQDACLEEFGPGHRMCTVKEAAETVAPPVLTGDDAWLLREDVLLSCTGWLSAAGSADSMVVDVDGGFRKRPCNIARPVACCSR